MVLLIYCYHRYYLFFSLDFAIIIFELFCQGNPVENVQELAEEQAVCILFFS